MGWNTKETGGLLAHIVGTIETSRFATNSESQNPNKPSLVWHVVVDDILQANFEGTPPESITVKVGLGNGWTEDEAGLTVEHSDREEAFNSNSSLGKIIDLMVGKKETYGSNSRVLDGDGDVKYDMTPLMDYMNEQGFDDPRRADIWEGLQFEFRGIGFKYRNQSEDDVFMNILPVRFVGSNDAVRVANTDSSSAAASGPKVPPVESTPAPSSATGTSTLTLNVEAFTNAGATPEQVDDLANLAGNAASHTAFAKEALSRDYIRSNPDLMGLVADESNFR